MEASAIPAPAVTRPAAPPAGRFLRLRSDEQLVALFRAGDEAAFQAIHDRYRQRLFAYSRQMLGGSRQDAEDALQDVFLRAYGALRADSRPVSLRAWLYRVAHNRCIDHLRRPVPPPAEIFELSRRPLHDPIEEAERREDLRRLVRDVQGLPEQQRSALLMREIDGLSYAELADALDVTIPAVKSLLVRARIGLVEAGEARDTACVEIRESLALAHGRGVRASGLARRHMHECRDCRDYRTQLKAVQRGMAALSPSPVGFGPLASVAQILGIGGAGTSAAAGGGIALVSGTAVTKMAVVVCAVAVTAGGAKEVRQHMGHPSPATAQAATPSAAPSSGTGGTAPATATGVHFVEPLALPAVKTLAVVADHSKPAPRGARETKAELITSTDAADGAISPHATAETTASIPIEPSGGAAAPTEDTATSTSGSSTTADTSTPTESVTTDQPPVTAADPAPLTEPSRAPELDEPTVEAGAGGALAPRR